jgi:putative nucleotidyltransferase with HDIG domain
MITDRRLEVVRTLLRRLAASIKAVHLYSADHPIGTRTSTQLAEIVEQLLAEQSEVAIGVVDDQLIVDGEPVFGEVGAGEVVDRFKVAGIERLTITRGVTGEELSTFVRRLPTGSRGTPEPPSLDGLEHIRITKQVVQRRTDATTCDVAAVQQAYASAVSQVEHLWLEAVTSGKPDPVFAADIVDGLAELLGQNRRALMALTALCQYDNYTFTHMVNVSILTMAQARSLGLDGALLRQFGLAGLMHDVGKIRVPNEVLTKPDKLTDAEFAIMRKHPADGADILRHQTEMPPLASVVAFEHHLRIDGTGYPDGVRRATLNVATQLCAIADVYDAMRSQRAYQQAFPSDRILAVLRQHDGARFDQHLVRRFSQLLGIYPPGTLVRLDDGALAVVTRVHAPQPDAPAVRVVRMPGGETPRVPIELALWEGPPPGETPRRIVTPVDPATVGIDALSQLNDTAP